MKFSKRFQIDKSEVDSNIWIFVHDDGDIDLEVTTSFSLSVEELRELTNILARGGAASLLIQDIQEEQRNELPTVEG